MASSLCVVGPVRGILRTQFDRLEIECRSDREMHIDGEKPIKARVDNVFYAKSKAPNSDWQVVGLLEYKQPGSLEPTEWLAAMKPKTGRKVLCVENVKNTVYGNAFIISRKGNNYQWNRSHPIIGYFN